MLDHIGIQAEDVPASARFYDAVLAPLGARRWLEFEGGQVVSFGTTAPGNFWVSAVPSDQRDRAGRENHLAFTAPDRAAVDAFHAAALAVGAESLHAPRLWPEYHESYYGAFVRDPDGNNVEAVCHHP
ncbi:VOC family protein [Streptomyces albiaxialis]|uniref:VOC family protein n=1 Tax=Streptomyces albiaxialis TaxID=329523 RepID=A0ABP5HSH6_9ACTN